MRVCCLALVGALELLSGSVAAQEAVSLEVPDIERPGAFELVAAPPEVDGEDVRIFTPLSPVTVEAEPVKLPSDQSLEL